MLKPLTFEGRFECGLDAITKGKVCALVPVVQPHGQGLGLAVANESGYHAIPLAWCRGDTRKELADHADALNAELFGLDARTASSIITSTMFHGHRHSADHPST